MFATLRARLPRIGRWPRLALAGCCLLLALGSAAAARSPRRGQGATAAVVVAARDLPAGRPVTGADLRVARWPAALVPAQAHARPADVVGRRLAGPVARGEPVTAPRLLGRDLTTGLGPSFIAVAVPINDPHLADLVHPGDRVDVVATGRPATTSPEESSDAAVGHTDMVGTRLLVLAVLNGPSEADAADGAELVVAADRTAAVDLTRAGASQILAVVGEPP